MTFLALARQREEDTEWQGEVLLDVRDDDAFRRWYPSRLGDLGYSRERTTTTRAPESASWL